MKYLSKYLTYERATFSTNAVNSGLTNIPNDQELKSLILLAENVYDKICDRFGKVFASSVFRSARPQRDKYGRTMTESGRVMSVNALAGGSITSGHTKGEAIDLDGDSPDTTQWVKLDNNVLFKWIKDNLEYDQLIAEYETNGSPKWIHVGFRAVGNRQQTLIAAKNSAGNTVYMAYSDSLYRKVYRNSREVDLDVKDFEFEMPATDFQTAIDETHEEGWESEFEGNRATPEIVGESGVVEPEKVEVHIEDGTVVINVGETEVRVTIENH